MTVQSRCTQQCLQSPGIAVRWKREAEDYDLFWKGSYCKKGKKKVIRGCSKQPTQAWHML